MPKDDGRCVIGQTVRNVCGVYRDTGTRHESCGVDVCVNTRIGFVWSDTDKECA